MNDDDIYNKGGTDEDVAKYAEQNGANLDWMDFKTKNDLRLEVLAEFNQVYKLAPADYTENCTNVVMSLFDRYFDIFIKDKLTEVNRFEVIDHRKCFYCRGTATSNYRQKDGSYKQQLCDKCDGSGIKGGRVYGAFSNPETSIMEIDLSFQDDGRTLKVFIKDKEAK